MQILGIPRSIEQNGSALTRFLMPTKKKCLQITTIANCNPFAIFMAGRNNKYYLSTHISLGVNIAISMYLWAMKMQWEMASIKRRHFSWRVGKLDQFPGASASELLGLSMNLWWLLDCEAYLWHIDFSYHIANVYFTLREHNKFVILN